MLGWWVDEAKGYRLEDLENGKLIASRDVRFFEDDSPSDLASIEVQDTPANNQDVNTLVNDAIQKNITPLPIQKDDTLLKESPSPLAVPPFDDVEINSPAKVSGPDEVPNLSPLPVLQRSGREQKTPSCFALMAIGDIITLGNVNFTFIAIAEEPKTYQEAIHSPHLKQWEQAIKSEFAQLQKLGVFKVVDGLPKGRKAVGSRIVFREKQDGHGNLIKFKARIVAKGFSQIPGEDFTDTFSLVAKFSTLWIFLAYVAYLDWDLHHVDVIAAYLHGPLGEEIYMTIPEGIENSGSGHYWKLKKALYGLKQAGRQWKKRLHEVLIKFGFIRAFADNCLYIKHHEGNITLLILVYVDDIAIAGPDGCHIIFFKSFLVTRDCSRCLIYLNQSAYIQHTITRFGLENSTPVSTPLAVKHDLTLSQSPTTEAEKRVFEDYAGDIHYLSLVGSLLFATQTRLNIQFAVGLVAQFSNNPGIAHLEVAKHILRYLKSTVNYNLVLGKQEEGKFDLVGWSDSNWAQDHDDHRSTSGFVFDVAGSSISWFSKKQATVATSSVEAEYVALANVTKEAIWLRTLLTELDFPPTMATMIHADNQGCIALANNPVSYSCAKHIDIRHHFI